MVKVVLSICRLQAQSYVHLPKWENLNPDLKDTTLLFFDIYRIRFGKFQ